MEISLIALVYMLKVSGCVKLGRSLPEAFTMSSVFLWSRRDAGKPQAAWWTVSLDGTGPVLLTHYTLVIVWEAELANDSLRGFLINREGGIVVLIVRDLQ